MTAPQILLQTLGKEPVPESSCGTPGDADHAGDAGHGAPAAEVADVLTSGATSVGPQGRDHRETSNHYRGELFRFIRYRVAVCPDGIQWLYQRQRPGFPAVGAAWDTLGYCVNRAALTRLHRAHTSAEAEEIAALPERIGT